MYTRISYPDPLKWLISNPEHIQIEKYRNGFALREYHLSYSARATGNRDPCSRRSK